MYLLFAIVCVEKVLICGVCKNGSDAAPVTIRSIEALGEQFADYAVCVYENNSSDNTAAVYQEWSKRNLRVQFVSAIIDESQTSRTERIARARNEVLSLARDSRYDDCKYLIMADLDFHKALWPIAEILQALAMPEEWDCLCANGVNPDGQFLDLYSLRDTRFPLGPEVMGDAQWWGRLETMRRTLDGETWIPVYSAFGGLAIYKRSDIISFSYSGVVTEDLRQYYERISEIWPIEFVGNTIWEHANDPCNPTCCEHVTLHASMAMRGLDKIFIVPKMRMYY